MPWFVSDRTLWAAVLFGAVLAYHYVPAHLVHVANITRVPETSNTGPNKQLRVDAEQALSLETLRVLSDGYSHDIRAAAIKIVAKRSINSRTKQLILQDLASSDGAKRWKAISALRLLFDDQTLSDRSYASQFGDPRSLRAIINALHHLLSDHVHGQGSTSQETTMPPSPVYPSHRPAHEYPLLLILRDVLSTSSLQSRATSTSILKSALKAGLVSKWLTNYPFPCALAENSRFGYQKSDVCRLMNGNLGGNDEPPWESDDPVMACIIQHIADYAPGVEALRNAGLLSLKSSRDRADRSEDHHMNRDVRMVNGESTAGALTPPEMQELLASARDDGWHSQINGADPNLESLRRRRNRETIVVAEAGAPLRRENIFHRQDSDVTDTSAMFRDGGDLLHPDDGLQQSQVSLEHVAELGELMAMPEQPWDLRRQEIEGEAIVNESIRGTVGSIRLPRNSNVSRITTDESSSGIIEDD